MKIGIIGANGQLGMDLCSVFKEQGDQVLRYLQDRLEVTDPESVRAILAEDQPDLVVNTAAMHHVEDCEADPEAAFRVNALGARNVAHAVRDYGGYLVHISTDYVFDGGKGTPYLEDDRAIPLNVYGNTKLAGEHFVLTESPESCVLRVCGLYGLHPCLAKGLNFVELMLKLGRERDEVRVVENEFVTPTSTREVARQIAALARQPVAGLCHSSAEGSCSWHAFAAEIFRQAGVETSLQVADPSEFPMKTMRPLYSVMENAVLKEHGVNTFLSWQDGLADYLAARAAGNEEQAV